MRRAFARIGLLVCLSGAVGACTMNPGENPLDPTTTQGLFLSLYRPTPEQLPVSDAVIWSRADDAYITSGITISPERMNGTSVSGPSVPIAAASVGGQSAFYFNGTTHLRGLAPQMQSNTMSVLTVFRRTVPGGNNTFVALGSSTGGFQMRLNGNILEILKSNVLGIVTGVATFTNTDISYIETFTYDGAGNASIFVNGTLDASATNAQVFTFNPTNYTIGGKADGSVFMQGYIAEVIVFSRAVTTAERQVLECYLSKRYAISVPFTCP